MKKEAKIIILSAIVTFFLTIILIIFTFNTLKVDRSDYKYSDKEIEELNKKIIEKYNLNDEELSNLTNYQKEKLLSDSGIIEKEIKDDISKYYIGKKELTKTEIERLEEQYVEKICNKDYYGIIKDFNKKREIYDMLSENSNTLTYIYEAALDMYNCTNSTDKNAADNIISEFKEPRVALISSLQLPEKSRRKVIINEDSLTPLYVDKISILSFEEIKDKDLSDETIVEIYKDEFESYNIYKIKFILDKNSLIAYILQNEESKKCLIYKIVAYSNSNVPYKTVKDYSN